MPKVVPQPLVLAFGGEWPAARGGRATIAFFLIGLEHNPTGVKRGSIRLCLKIKVVRAPI
ncbi:hypothetical protein CHELA40_14518 [Chelatococcus asaccharovorans]|nr:hypothetical protein CHELA17_61102 [Chelatococcus asaccharovorans]CAH1678090.1 hypothetical protein CHELA40_14518 [Chelatococcus asaccharovorans]